MSKLSEVIREAERIKKYGAGVTEYTRAYNAMLRELKNLSSRLDIYGEAHGDEV